MSKPSGPRASKKSTVTHSPYPFSPSPSKKSSVPSSNRRSSTIATSSAENTSHALSKAEGAFARNMPIKINDVKKNDLSEYPVGNNPGWRRIKYEKSSSSPTVSFSSDQKSLPHPYQPQPQYQCWRLTVPLEKFMSTVPNNKLGLRAQDVTIHFPVFDKFYAVKHFRVKGKMTTEKLLALVQRMSVIAIAVYVKERYKAKTGQDLGRDVTYGDVHPLLDRHTTCSLLITPARPGYNVYVM